MDSLSYSVGYFIGYFSVFFIYLLPFFISLFRRNFKVKTLMFNLFLGWTVVMWIICMVWACRKDEPEAPAATAVYVPVTPAVNTYADRNAYTPVANTPVYTPVANSYVSQTVNSPESNALNVSSVKFCPVCGTAHKDGDKFCGCCGKQLQ